MSSLESDPIVAHECQACGVLMYLVASSRLLYCSTCRMQKKPITVDEVLRVHELLKGDIHL